MPKKILLADDSLTIQKVVELTFSEEDYEVVVVGDGAQAIERIEADPPDIVLADVMMPKKNGYEVCQHVKSSPALAHIPVLLLAGKFEPFDSERARAVGADRHILKPFESNALVRNVNELLAAVHPAAPAAEPEEPAAGTVMMSELPAFSRSAAGDATPTFGEVRSESVAAAAARFEGAAADQYVTPRAAAVSTVEEEPFGEEAPFAPAPSAMRDVRNSVTAQVARPAGADRSVDAGENFATTTPLVEEGEEPFAGDSFASEGFGPGSSYGDEAPFGEEPLAVPVAAAAEAPPAGIGSTTSPLAAGAAQTGGNPLPAAFSGSVGQLSEEVLNAIVERVVQRMSDETVREIAWQVVPDLAELLIKRKLEELS